MSGGRKVRHHADKSTSLPKAGTNNANVIVDEENNLSDLSITIEDREYLISLVLLDPSEVDEYILSEKKFTCDELKVIWSNLDDIFLYGVDYKAKLQIYFEPEAWDEAAELIIKKRDGSKCPVCSVICITNGRKYAMYSHKLHFDRKNFTPHHRKSTTSEWKCKKCLIQSKKNNPKS